MSDKRKQEFRIQFDGKLEFPRALDHEQRGVCDVKLFLPLSGGPTGGPGRRRAAGLGLSLSIPVRSARLELEFPWRRRYTRARKARQ